VSKAASKNSEEADSLSAIARAGVIKDVIEQMNPIVSEGVFTIGREGLHVSVIDPANVAQLHIDLEAEAFESVGDGQFPIGLNINRLSDYLKRTSSNDLVEFAYLPERRMLRVQHVNREFEMAAIDPDAIRRSPGDIDLDLPASFALSVEQFRSAAKDADLVSDHVIIESDPDAEEIRVSAKGDTDSFEESFSNEEVEDAVIPSVERSLFSTDYLVGDDGLLNPMPKDAILEFELGTDFPLMVAYDFDDGHGRVEFGLAPRIQSE